MDIFITAQIIGFVGYLLFVYAPSRNETCDVLRFECAGCLFLCVQWFLLGHLTLVASNFILASASLFTLFSITQPRKDIFLMMLYPLGAFVSFMCWQNTVIDYLALSSLFLMIGAKQSVDIAHLRLYSASGAFLMVLAGILAGAMPAIVFNFLFTSIHLWKVKEVFLPKNTHELT